MSHNCLLSLLTFWIKRSPEHPGQQVVPTHATEVSCYSFVLGFPWGPRCDHSPALRRSCQLPEFIRRARQPTLHGARLLGKPLLSPLPWLSRCLPCCRGDCQQERGRCVCPCLTGPSLRQVVSISGRARSPRRTTGRPRRPLPRMSTSLGPCRVFFKRKRCFAYVDKMLKESIERALCTWSALTQPPGWEEIKNIDHCHLKRKPSPNVKVCATRWGWGHRASGTSSRREHRKNQVTTKYSEARDNRVNVREQIRKLNVEGVNLKEENYLCSLRKPKSEFPIPWHFKNLSYFCEYKSNVYFLYLLGCFQL